MRYLLDTEAWLWIQAHPERLDHHTLLLSGASSQEIALKLRKGRMPLSNLPHDYVPDHMLASGLDGLAVEHSHALGVPRLDDHHRDPFNRLLVSQAMLENLPIISSDPSLSVYKVERIDATK